MTTLLIQILLGAAAVAAVVLAKWRYRVDLSDLGTVSEHWLAEQRANDRDYSER